MQKKEPACSTLGSGLVACLSWHAVVLLNVNIVHISWALVGSLLMTRRNGAFDSISVGNQAGGGDVPTN